MSIENNLSKVAPTVVLVYIFGGIKDFIEINNNKNKPHIYKIQFGKKKKKKRKKNYYYFFFLYSLHRIKERKT